MEKTLGQEQQTQKETQRYVKNKPIIFIDTPSQTPNQSFVDTSYKWFETEFQKQLPAVDFWIPNPEDVIFRITKNSLNIEFSRMFGVKDQDFDNFILSTKRCYNGKDMRIHLPLYLNYFEKYFDPDHELIMNLYNIKYMIDYHEEYDKDIFVNDIVRYIFQSDLSIKAQAMVEFNYELNLDSTRFRNDKNQALVYKDKHAKIMLWLSIMQNLCIPLITHFIYIKEIEDANEFLLEIFNILFKLVVGVNIYNKLSQTSITNVKKNAKINEMIWGMQQIRGKDVVTHSIESVENIILNIMPKYTFEKNIISFNHSSINRHNHYQIYGVQFEYDYIPLNSANRDADYVSGFDKYESYTVKQNPALHIQNKVAAEHAMVTIERLFGDGGFRKEEIAHQFKSLTDDISGEIIIPFQKMLIFNLFSKYFGDSKSITAIGRVDYLKLMIASKKILLAHNMKVLPYIISGKIIRFQTKKNVNKKEMEKLESSKYIDKIMEKYRNKKILVDIQYIIASILSSEFMIIDYDNKKIDGKIIDCVRLSDFIMEEVLMFVLLI